MINRARASSSLTVIGNLTVDEVCGDRARKLLPGGSAFYVSASAAFFKLAVHVFSRIGPDYPFGALEWLKGRGVDVTGVRTTKAPTTRFALSYRGGSRKLRIVHAGKRLFPSTLKGPWEAVHLGPVFGELTPQVIPWLRRNSGFLSTDLQGFLRYEGRSGFVQLRPARLGSLLSSFDLVKLTSEELRVQTSDKEVSRAAKKLMQNGPRRLMITMGSRGALLTEKGGGLLRVPAYPEPNTVDPTGAGDALVGGWLATFLLTGDSVWAASVGSAIASLVVRRRGPAKFRLSRGELFRRSAWVYARTEWLQE